MPAPHFCCGDIDQETATTLIGMLIGMLVTHFVSGRSLPCVIAFLSPRVQAVPTKDSRDPVSFGEASLLGSNICINV